MYDLLTIWNNGNMRGFPALYIGPLCTYIPRKIKAQSIELLLNYEEEVWLHLIVAFPI
jgi:hypothetical protein